MKPSLRIIEISELLKYEFALLNILDEFEARIKQLEEEVKRINYQVPPKTWPGAY